MLTKHCLFFFFLSPPCSTRPIRFGLALSYRTERDDNKENSQPAPVDTSKDDDSDGDGPVLYREDEDDQKDDSGKFPELVFPIQNSVKWGGLVINSY